MDEVHEPVREELINLSPKKEIPATQLTAKRVCPKCEGIVMMRHFYSPLKKVMVDECPNCGGFWLDAGELAGLREENKLEKERKRATQVRLSQISLHAIVSELSAFEGEVGHAPRMTRTLRVMNASVKTLLRTPEE
jgi:Zn-finger nucleic acid-binding protein